MFTIGEIDITGYNRFTEGLHNALFGTGQTGDARLLVRTEGAQLAWGISTALGPRTKAKGVAAVEKDIRREFAPGPQQAFEQSQRKPRFGETDITWLYAGPNFLVGVRDADLQPGMSQSSMRAKLKEARTAGFPRGNTWPAIGQRGKQHIKRLNRTVVGQSALQKLIDGLSGRVGLLRARFAHDAFRLGRKTIPKWLRDHFDTVGNDGTAILNESPGSDAHYIEFGARAPGLVSNPHIQKAIQGAIHQREHKLREKMEKILIGYTYDWNTGRVFMKHRGEDMLKELEANERMFEDS